MLNRDADMCTSGLGSYTGNFATYTLLHRPKPLLYVHEIAHPWTDFQAPVTMHHKAATVPKTAALEPLRRELFGKYIISCWRPLRRGVIGL